MKQGAKRRWRIGLWLVLLVACGVLLKLSNRTMDSKEITSMHIEVNELENAFIDKEAIAIKVQQYLGDSIIGFKKEHINYFDLEERLLENPFISDVDVFADMKGKLTVSIEQREPIFRVINKEGVSYYIDNHGDIMPLSHKFTSRVIVATGEIDDANWQAGMEEIGIMEDIIMLAKFFEREPLYKAMIEQVYVNNENEIELVPVFGNHVVLLGTTDELEEKMKKLETFYSKTIDKTSWNRLSMIDLKYNGQVVCTIN